jgi:hypothetical protein
MAKQSGRIKRKGVRASRAAPCGAPARPATTLAGASITVAKAIEIANRARLDRPEKVDWQGRPAKRRRVGDVLRWGANNRAVDQIVSDLRAAASPSTFIAGYHYLTPQPAVPADVNVDGPPRWVTLATKDEAPAPSPAGAEPSSAEPPLNPPPHRPWWRFW